MNPSPEVRAGILVLLLFLALLYAGRWVFVAMPTRRWTLAQIAAVRSRVRVEQPSPEKTSAREAAVASAIEEALDRANDLAGPTGWRASGEILVWSGGRELSAWSLVHEAERLSVAILDEASVQARLERAIGQIGELSKEQQEAWEDILGVEEEAADEEEDDDQRGAEGSELPHPEDRSRSRKGGGIAGLLGVRPFERTRPKKRVMERRKHAVQGDRREEESHAEVVATPSNSRRARALLGAFLGDLYDARDQSFVTLATLQNKTMWVVGIGWVLVAVLVAQSYAEILLAGAIGGLLSRTQRVMRGGKKSGDYGLTWVSIFLSPVAGALAAWAGIHLITLLQGLDVMDLSTILPRGVALTTAIPPAVLGLAVVFGFSERLLDRFVRKGAGGLLGEGEDEDDRERDRGQRRRRRRQALRGASATTRGRARSRPQRPTSKKGGRSSTSPPGSGKNSNPDPS